MTPPRRIVVVGASAAGLTAAESLRADGFDGELTVVGSEPHLAYDRPPLSKQLLAGAWAADRLELLPRDRYDDLSIGCRLGAAATALDVAGRTVRVGGSDGDGDGVDGVELGFDRLLIATGVRPRTWPGTDGLRGVHVLRTLDDTVAFKAAAHDAGRVVVIGAGFLGAEAAATLRGLGIDVTLVDPSPAPMLRQVGPVVAGLLADLHAEHGVDLRLGRSVAAIERDGDRVTGVRLDDGARFATTCVLVAIGTTPATEWLAGSGLDLADGVGCDAWCRAAPGVFAAGDVARWFHRGRGASLRVEHRTNATEQAMAAARAMLDPGDPYEPVPYVWSDQYDTKLQTYGETTATDRFAVISGSIDERRFVALYGRAERVVGALGWRSPRELLRARALVADGVPWSEAVAA
ncbi:NAD(P)/FAD-dependent oxidoreductase [Jiangella mangrovi]|uniref:NADPH-dependent 2,4-dienoyl-CoA reductase/sulfur reductase-like enzyme n=1 Tax=Jiangella mangrovi TaxID=1524084 RepID=A0A7W9GRQ1_9ACTN|nr:FAD/NAD(P)-binding oxidoreductase [Jiangella mangrovi]MBB5788506.1 NADPH-dependent 2,4-dienoyl-CoA reductase/sulfur reductase-like enzyme [Jiangella mangrovi]